MPPIVAALLSCACATDSSLVDARRSDARLYEEQEESGLEAAVTAVFLRTWAFSEGDRRVGTRLVIRLRMDGQKMVIHGCEVEPGQGPQRELLEEGRFRLALKEAMERYAWGWGGDVVLVLRRLDTGWLVEDGLTPLSSTARVESPSEAASPHPPRDARASPSSRKGVSRRDSARAAREEEARKAAEAARWRAVERKLHEYETWGRRLLETYAPSPRLLEPGYLLTEHALREKSLLALANATHAWAYAHTDDPDFLRHSPTEVALYLLASRSALATVVELGRQAPPHLDYTPPYERPYTEDELLEELVIGLIPYFGDLVELDAATSGYSPTGHRLGPTERVLSVLGVVLPFTHGRLLKKGGEQVVQQVALLSGKSLQEVHALARVASHLSPQEVREVERLMHSASKGHSFTREELELLERLSVRLELPLREALAALRRGQPLPVLGARTLADGTRLLPGTPAHMAQRWVDYQFRHPEKYRRISLSMDPEWERLYRSIITNKRAGNAFEGSILQTRGYEKNTAVMMPPPGSKAQGFIPDSVLHNPNPDELVWGRPYHFVEAKARQELSLSGNLKAMLEYVRDHGGHVELWIRSAQHPDGATRLTHPLQRLLSDLQSIGKVTVRPHP